MVKKKNAEDPLKKTTKSKRLPIISQYRNIYRKTMRRNDILEFLEHRTEFIISEDKPRSCCGWAFTTAKALLNHVQKDHSDIYASYIERNSKCEAENIKQIVGNTIQKKDNKAIGVEEIVVSLNTLHYRTNYVSLKKDSTGFICWETGLSPCLNSEKDILNISARILLDHSNHTFQFLDRSLLSDLKSLSILLDKVEETDELKKQIEKFQKQIRKEKKNKKIETAKTKIEHRVLLSDLKYGQGFVSIIYKRRCYYYKDPKIRNYDKIIRQIFSRLSKARKHSLNTFLIEVIIDIPAGSFIFKNIDFCDYINELKESSLAENNETENRNRIRLNKAAKMFNVSKNTIIEFLAKNGFTINNPLPSTKLTEEMYKLLVKEYQGEKDMPQKPSTTYEKMTLGTSNIHFYNGYYLIFQTSKGEIDKSVAPYRVDDPNSHEILNLVHKYFEQKLEEKHIIVKLDDAKIVEPSKFELFQLKNYVRYLNQNLDEKGGWWKEVQNYRKPSLKQCRSISAEVAKKKVSLKNGYLDSLVSMQSEIELIPVYEINNHGKKEAAFIFSINMPNNRRAVIFENVSNDAATATWVFVTKIGNYEPCINLVFDYFTDYTIFKKRFSLRLKTVNPPEKFKAENYIFIDHDDLRQWLKKLNTILEQAPEPSEIQFVPGLHIPKSSETRKGHNEAITTKHLHNQLIRKLYDKLCNKYGEANVGTENRVGTKRIDVVVKGDGYYDIYEVKTAENAYDCVQEALGQLFIYTVLSCHSNIRKMVVVGMSEAPKEFEQYLSTQRKSNSLQFYYMKV